MAAAAAPGGVKLDGTLGGSAATLSGPTFNITQNLGSLAGGNLFFSFQYFNVGTGQAALFTTTSPGISNVISRVTGGSASSIDGIIALLPATGAPNFFLINPSGVSFTSNAVIDVPAAFYVSTANYLKFGDGNLFYADPTKASTLSMAAPEAFGFLGTTRAPVNVTGAGLSGGPYGLGLDEFQIVAGDVTIDGQGTLGGIFSPAGDVRVIATGAQSTEVPLSGPFTSNDGIVTIKNGGEIETGAGLFTPPPGIYVSAGQLSIQGSSPFEPTGLIAGGGGAVSVAVGTLAIDANGVTTQGNITGIISVADNLQGAPVNLNVGAAATLSNGALISTTTQGAGAAANVSINAASLNLIGTGLSSGTGISSVTLSGASGQSGNLSIVTTGPTTLSNGGAILATSAGVGNVGNVSLTASSFSADGGPSAIFTGISSSAASNVNSGTVSVTTTGAATLTSGGVIQAQTYGSGNAGDVTLKTASLAIAGDSLSVATGLSTSANVGSSGAAGTVTVNATGAITVTNGGAILSSTEGTGDAGTVAVKAASLSITDSTSSLLSEISSAALSGSSGNAGQVSVTTSGATSLASGGEIVSSTSASGRGGSVTLMAGSLAIDGEGSAISSAAYAGSTGAGGSVTVNVDGIATLSNGGQINSAAQAGSGGQPGTIQISATTLQLGAGSQISIQNDATIADPTQIVPTQISILAGNILMKDGTISAASTGNIDASSIDITGQGPLWLEHSSITTSVTGTTQGNGGDIHITVPSIIFDTGAIQANTSAPQALGGDVTIDALAIVPSFGSYTLGGALVPFDPTVAGLNVVQAAAPAGVSGTLSVTLPDLDVQNSLARLAGEPATTIALGRGLCRFRPGSSLSLAGRGGLPVSARDPLWADADAVTDAPASTVGAEHGGEARDRPQVVAAIACR